MTKTFHLMHSKMSTNYIQSEKIQENICVRLQRNLHNKDLRTLESKMTMHKCSHDLMKEAEKVSDNP
jgi:hypothetical protein